jgi:hypothetical protein
VIFSSVHVAPSFPPAGNLSLKRSFGVLRFCRLFGAAVPHAAKHGCLPVVPLTAATTVWWRQSVPLALAIYRYAHLPPPLRWLRKQHAQYGFVPLPATVKRGVLLSAATAVASLPVLLLPAMRWYAALGYHFVWRIAVPCRA